MANDKKQTVWLVGGGTGGHVVPLLAVAEVLKRDPHVHLVYIGNARSLEQKLAKETKLPFYTISSGKLRRYVTVGSVLLNLRDIFLIMAGILKSRSLIRRQRPALIFSKGGPVALPVAIAAHQLRVPLITHESDAVIGATNRIIARYADTILTGFPASYYPLTYASKLTHTGVPVRHAFSQHPAHATHHTPTVLVLGGSQGSLAINEALKPSLNRLLDQANVVHITGEAWQAQFEKFKQTLDPHLAKRYTVLAFTTELAQYMKQATVVVSRSSSTIFEIATLGKPMILIPLPSAAGDHQTKNAEIFARYHAAIMLRQANLTPEVLCETIEQILNTPALQRQLREGTRMFASGEAAAKVAAIIRSHLPAK